MHASSIMQSLALHLRAGISTPYLSWSTTRDRISCEDA
ncbi:hypothetical protein trd_0320 [Thermomicrobium roseum DSM 5159]|uniref:Uncharacterized protein n=1 Tax=Thermomicrobium roseum (strain ATCC 27502 / DSM 5159 / P-2) TaxID=309801 RepID=B9KXX8_THERP|nr:hypothetical protein trd_0320 [Thermomicrobium roseum DSM 5159]